MHDAPSDSVMSRRENIREDEYLKTFVKEYETLRCIQESMRQRMDEICNRGAAEQIRKQIYDAVYRIEANKIRRARAELLEYRRRIEDDRRSCEERGTCPNCGVKKMRIRMQPLPAFSSCISKRSPRIWGFKHRNATMGDAREFCEIDF